MRKTQNNYDTKFQIYNSQNSISEHNALIMRNQQENFGMPV